MSKASVNPDMRTPPSLRAACREGLNVALRLLEHSKTYTTAGEV